MDHGLEVTRLVGVEDQSDEELYHLQQTIRADVYESTGENRVWDGSK